MASYRDSPGRQRGEFDAEIDAVDAVVIGSGFGGSVAAWRLKHECPQARVLMLERGMPYPPGSFARTPREMRANFWEPADWLYGLYEVWLFRHAKAIVASGLGGGSLIYANVLFEAPEETFTSTDRSNGGRPWPLPYEVVADRYPWIRARLGANPLPSAYADADPAARTAVPKTRQFMEAAHMPGALEPELAELAVAFGRPGHRAEPGVSLGDDNLHHRERRACTLIGECDLGCNEGAKNTLDYTFLTEFWRHDPRAIRTCCEALDIAVSDDQAQGRYEVRYVQHAQARRTVEKRAEAEGREREDAQLLDPDAGGNGIVVPIRRVRAKVVVLAAGTLGSTRLLLASRAKLPPLSPQLGRRFSSNGDLITFARDCVDPQSKQLRNLAPSRGPVITAYAAREVGGQRVWIEDAGGPTLSEWGWQLPELPTDAIADARRLVRSQLRWYFGRVAIALWNRWQGRISSDVARLLGNASSSASMLPMLAMGRDVAAGRLRLDGDSLALDWDPRESAAYFEQAEATARIVAKQLGGRLGPSWWSKFNRGLTVHPLGGCAMGKHHGEGVVDTKGQVFGCPGLFVADGSVMPGPIGPNPSLTIAAIADHIATQAAQSIDGPMQVPQQGAGGGG